MNSDIFRRRPANNPYPNHTQNKSGIVVGDHSRDQFKPPEIVAKTDEFQSAPRISDPGSANQPNKPKRSLKAWLLGLSGKQKALLTAGCAVAFSGLIIGSYFLFFAEKPPVEPPKQANQTKTPEAPPAPTTIASNLSGLQVEPSVNERPVTAIMIENSLDARPQSGLNQASVIFEAVAEGGITRFVTLFQDTEPEYIGPVRSVRPYYIQWALGFDAAIAHAGGSAEALNNIKQWGVKDLNHSSSHFWRVNNRTAPHNLYTSIAKLREYESQKGFGKAKFTPLARKTESPAATVTARVLDFNISSTNFNTHYEYDAATNSYKRSVGGKVHTDEKSGSQLSPKVVVALVMPQGKNHIYTTYQTIGSGTAVIFQDGTATEVTWRKNSNSDQFVFTNQSGQPVGLNPGQTWFTVLGGTDRIAYAP